MNKRELAIILGISLPTVGAMIDRYPDFPVVERGTNGKEWRFDAEACAIFLREIEDQEREEEARKARRIAQFSLPLSDPGAATGAGEGPLSLDDVRRIKATDDLRKARGFLLDVPLLRMKLEPLIQRWARAQRSVIEQAGRDFALPDIVVRQMVGRLAEAQRTFARDLLRVAPGLGADEEVPDDAAV